MKFSHYLLLLIACLFSDSSSACVVDENQYSDTVKVHNEGNGNFLVSVPTQINSNSLRTVYLNIKEKDKNEYSVQGKLDITIRKNKGYVHIHKGKSITLEASVTVWHKGDKGCPIVTVVQI